MSTMRQWRKYDARGQSLVEVALALPILLLLLLGAIDYARVLSAEQRLENATHVATLQLLAHPSLSAQPNLTNLIQGESGLSPVSANATYSLSGESTAPGAVCCDQVAITATYAYTLVLPGLQNLHIGALNDGKFHITVSAAGMAATSPPIVTDPGGGVTVAPPGDSTVPLGLALTCTLYQNGNVVPPLKPCSPGSTYTWPLVAGSTYTATVMQANGVTSPPSTPVPVPGP